MKVKIYDTVKQFLKENEELLLKQEAVTQLILANSHGNKGKETSKEMFFGRVDAEKGNIKLVFCNVLPYNLIIYNLDEDSAESVKTLVDYLIDEDIPIQGINANKKVSYEFIETYKNRTKKEFKQRLAMDIMELRTLNKDISLPKGVFRVAEERDFETLLNWHVNFTQDALGEDKELESFREKLISRLEDKSIYVFENEEHKLVSMAAATRQLVNGVSVSLVYSDRKERGKGYGFAVVYNLSKLYLEKGNKFCTLFVDKKNPISNAVYKKIGYKILEDNYDYRIV